MLSCLFNIASIKKTFFCCCGSIESWKRISVVAERCSWKIIFMDIINLSFVVLLSLIYSFVTEVRLFTDYALESAIILNETSRVPGYGNMTLKRSAHMNPKIFLEIELTQNLEDYDADGRVFYSPLGNNRYLLLPFKVNRQPICKILNTAYRDRAMHDIHKYSNFPFSEDKSVDLCGLMPQGHYYWHNYSADLSIIPRSIATGRYRVQFRFYKRNVRESCKGVEFQSLFT
ncbi:uncharacterized protein LOC119071086 [Bradysia coprophila]|uniref:uncharacterized protein LOC119071086 n=1 Tax=Bradysia coprophila TaxID=38358 RepID=UPI00187DB894|nr:uncharacterized protein LOC119071086 [Bradysia coprophila]